MSFASLTLVLLALLTCRPVPRATVAAARGTLDAGAPLAEVDAAHAESPTVEAVARWPEAPMQHAPWEPPDRSAFSRAVVWLFDHGLPDPRGLRYVRARVTVGELWSGEGAEVEANGWLLPRADAPGSAWFLGWNGALYEPLGPVGEADLDADAAPFLTARDGGDPLHQ